MKGAALGFVGGGFCGTALSYLGHFGPITYGQAAILVVVGVILAVRGCRGKGKVVRIY